MEILKLPNELIMEICENLGLKDLFKISRCNKTIYEIVQSIIRNNYYDEFKEIPLVINILSCYDKTLKIRVILYGDHIWCKTLYTESFFGSKLCELRNVNEAVLIGLDTCVKKKPSIKKIIIQIYEINSNFKIIHNYTRLKSLKSLKRKKKLFQSGILKSEIYWKLGDGIFHDGKIKFGPFIEANNSGDNLSIHVGEFHKFIIKTDG